MACPTRTTVAPSSMAISKSPDIPIDNPSRQTPAGASCRIRQAQAGFGFGFAHRQQANRLRIAAHPLTGSRNAGPHGIDIVPKIVHGLGLRPAFMLRMQCSILVFRYHEQPQDGKKQAGRALPSFLLS